MLLNVFNFFLENRIIFCLGCSWIGMNLAECLPKRVASEMPQLYPTDWSNTGVVALLYGHGNGMGSFSDSNATEWKETNLWMFRYGNISSPASRWGSPDFTPPSAIPSFLLPCSFVSSSSWLAGLAALAPISPALDAVEWAWTRTHARKNAKMNAWKDAK